jgi:LmbE family N-acetylglucosaminyl deacetylase
LLSPPEIGARRRGEALAALSELGVPGGHASFLGAPDGLLSRLDAAQSAGLVAALCALMARLGPDAVLLPCRRDGSSEHEGAFALVTRAVRAAGLAPRILEFPVWARWRPARLLGPALVCPRVWRADISRVRDRKARAVARHETQVLPLPPDTAPALPHGFAPMFLGGDEHFLEH